MTTVIRGAERSFATERKRPRREIPLRSQFLASNLTQWIVPALIVSLWQLGRRPASSPPRSYRAKRYPCGRISSHDQR